MINQPKRPKSVVYCSTVYPDLAPFDFDLKGHCLEIVKIIQCTLQMHKSRTELPGGDDPVLAGALGAICELYF